MKIRKVPDFISYRDIIKGFRKPIPPPGKAMKDKTKYTRKMKHQSGRYDEPFGVSFFV
jgi:hypothetical protein